MHSVTLVQAAERGISPTLTSSAAGSRASRIVLQENARLHLTNATSGESSTESFAKLGPDGCWLKMSQGFYQARMDGSLVEFSGTWPVRGMMRNGACYRLPPWERRTYGKGCSLWPTATSVQRPNEGNVRLLRAKVLSGEMSEGEATAMLGKSPMGAQGKVPRQPEITTAEWAAVDRLIVQLEEENRTGKRGPTQMWPTPTSQDAKNDAGPSQWERNSDPLNVAVKRWPTPGATAWHSTGNRGKVKENAESEEQYHQMTAGNFGQLNPTWVAALMGFPPDWVDLGDRDGKTGSPESQSA